MFRAKTIIMKMSTMSREKFIQGLSRQVAREAAKERARYGAHVAEYLMRRAETLIAGMRGEA